MIDQLKEQIQKVANARIAAKKVADEKSAAYQKWLQDNLLLITEAALTVSLVDTEETKLREMTLAIFKADPTNKKPDPNVGIREGEKLIYDPTLALNYAKEHGVALKLDIANFEKMAKIPELRPGFVTVEKVITATIATTIKIGEE